MVSVLFSGMAFNIHSQLECVSNSTRKCYFGPMHLLGEDADVLFLFHLTNFLGGSSSGYNPQAQGGWALPSTEQSQHSGRVIADTRDRAGSSRTQHQSRMKSDVNGRSGYSRGRATE